MYEKYVDKLVKVVWVDGGKQKAVVGKLTDFSEDFLTIQTEHNLLSLNKKCVISISEYYSNGGMKR